MRRVNDGFHTFVSSFLMIYIIDASLQKKFRRGFYPDGNKSNELNKLNALRFLFSNRTNGVTVAAIVAEHVVSTTNEAEVVGGVTAVRCRTPIVAIATCTIKRCYSAITCSRKENIVAVYF